MSARKKPVVVLLAASETSSLVLYGLYDVLLSVGTAYPDLVEAATGEPLLDVRIATADGQPFRCLAGNIAVEPHASLATVGSVDVVIVCDMYVRIDVPPTGRFTEEVEWLRRVHANGALLCSVCSGSLILAEAGLLNGRQCAGHWALRDLFRSAYPNVNFVLDAVLNVESASEGIVTAGSITAWQDLALYVIAQLCGNEHALHTAKVYLLGGHEEGQLPFAVMTRRIQSEDGAIARCQQWIADNYAAANPVAAMVEVSGLSRRTFMRRFRIATGYLPLEYVHRLRIEEAKQMIEGNSEPLEDVGSKVGYEDSAFFRRLFKRQTGITPAAYRRKFAPIVRFASGFRYQPR